MAPTWGKEQNVPFQYRLVVGDVKGDRQTVKLFLTPESGKDRNEFLARSRKSKVSRPLLTSPTPTY